VEQEVLAVERSGRRHAVEIIAARRAHVRGVRRVRRVHERRDAPLGILAGRLLGHARQG
jgi:hypothetical protein